MTEIADHVLFLTLAVGLPVWSAVAMRGLERRLAQDAERARLTAYAETIVTEWALVVAALALWIVAGRSATSLGLAAFGDLPFAVTSIATALLVVVLLRQIRTARSMTSEAAGGLRDQIAAVAKLMPHTAGERAVFFGVSITAGFCEELLYRGFLMAYLAQWIGWWQAGVASAVIFGIGHAHYQGTAGVLKTAALGGVMAALYLFSGSIWPAIVLHAAIDVQAGAIAYEALNRTAAVMQQPAADAV
jgi:membrane protease YdiL (CAAX protease family)